MGSARRRAAEMCGAAASADERGILARQHRTQSLQHTSPARPLACTSGWGMSQKEGPAGSRQREMTTGATTPALQLRWTTFSPITSCKPESPDGVVLTDCEPRRHGLGNACSDCPPAWFGGWGTPMHGRQCGWQETCAWEWQTVRRRSHGVGALAPSRGPRTCRCAAWPREPAASGHAARRQNCVGIPSARPTPSRPNGGRGRRGRVTAA